MLSVDRDRGVELWDSTILQLTLVPWLRYAAWKEVNWRSSEQHPLARLYAILEEGTAKLSVSLILGFELMYCLL